MSVCKLYWKSINTFYFKKLCLIAFEISDSQRFLGIHIVTCGRWLSWVDRDVRACNCPHDYNTLTEVVTNLCRLNWSIHSRLQDLNWSKEDENWTNVVNSIGSLETASGFFPSLDSKNEVRFPSTKQSSFEVYESRCSQSQHHDNVLIL